MAAMFVCIALPAWPHVAVWRLVLPSDLCTRKLVQMSGKKPLVNSRPQQVCRLDQRHKDVLAADDLPGGWVLAE
eukprot:11450076-Alexandrium_andersonii.AAC.1